MAFAGRPLFEGVTVEIPGGRRVAVTGANGTGKTTFLKIVAGLMRQTTGIVAVTRADGPAEEAAERRRELVGYAGPDINAYDELSAIENLTFFGKLRGVAAGECRERLERVGLARAKWTHPVKTYSSGMRQRVRLALSMLGSPAIVIWDEPTAMLDAIGRNVVHANLEQHAQGGGIALVATNDPAEIDGWGGGRIHFGGPL